MAQTVVLLHTQPGKPDHYDWLIDQPGLDHEHRLLTFRLLQRPDQHRSFRARKTPDHRAFYLNYEGPLTQNRGQVARILSGTVAELRVENCRLSGILDWGNGPAKLLATPLTTDPSLWQFEIDRPDHH